MAGSLLAWSVRESHVYPVNCRLGVERVWRRRRVPCSSYWPARRVELDSLCVVGGDSASV